MYHRNYTTYLNKELDFLKMLVVRFHEQDSVNDLELSVAMQKSQDIYEHFLRMKLTPEASQTETNEKKTEEKPAVSISETVIEQPKSTQPQQPMQPQRPTTQPQQSELPKQSTQPQPDIPQQPEYVAETETLTVSAEPVFNTCIGETKTKKPLKQKSETPKATILAEKLSPTDRHLINETLSQQNTGNDLSSKLQTASIASISSGIGLNDRFLFVRELFKGDNNLYKTTLKRLDTVDTLEEALDFINHHFNWDNNSEAAQKFLNLVHRRHS